MGELAMSPRDRARATPIGLARLVTAEGVPYRAAPVHNFLNTVFMRMVAAATQPGNESLDSWRRVIICLPTRMGKSDIFSTYGPAWFMGLYPHLNAGIITYEATFSEGFGRKARNILETFG